MARETICGIYKITNLVNGKVYIGQSLDIYKRWEEHKYNINYSKYSGILLYKAFNKYGLNNFKFEIVEVCEEYELDNKEKFYIDYFNSYIGFDNSNGYNMTLGGEGQTGIKWTEERKRKRSKLMKGRSPWNKGLKYHNQKMKGRFVKENNPFYGKKHTKEAIEKIRKAALNRKPYNRIKVVCDGIIFESITECAKFYNINPTTLSDWLSGKCGASELFIKMGLETIPPSNKIRPTRRAFGEANSSAKQVICLTTNKIYPTITEACKDTGANINTIIKVCKGLGKSAGKLKDGTKLRWMYYEDYLRGCEGDCEKQ